MIGRVIQSTAEQTTGELGYALNPVHDATLTFSSKDTPGNFQEFELQIVETQRPK